MDDILNLKCWEITKCREMDCRARAEPETPCWEIAKLSNDSFCAQYRVCEDCLVYLIKQAKTDLSNEEIERILHARKIK
jgi:predicted ATP-dependent Lon-type protease